MLALLNLTSRNGPTIFDLYERERNEPITTTQNGTVDLARRVLETKTHQKGLDYFTASAIVQVADALSPANRDKLNAMSIPQAANIVWKLVSKEI